MGLLHQWFLQIIHMGVMFNSQGMHILNLLFLIFSTDSLQ